MVSLLEDAKLFAVRATATLYRFPARLRGGARAPDEKMFYSAHPPGGLESVYGSYSWLRQNISYVAVEYAYAA